MAHGDRDADAAAGDAAAGLKPAGRRRAGALLRKLVLLLCDVAAAFAAMAAAFPVRYSIAERPPPDASVVISYAAVFALLAGLVFYGFRLYREIWRYTSVRTLWRIVQADLLLAVVFSVIAFSLTRTDQLPRSVPGIAAVLLVGLMAAMRLAVRYAFDRSRPGPRAMKVPVLLIGVGSRGESFIRDMGRHEHAPYEVIGMLSSRPELARRRLHGTEVLGRPEELAAVLARVAGQGRAAQRVILTGDETYAGAGEEMLAACDALGVVLSRLPRLAELRDGLESPELVKPVSIEDLLVRPQVRLGRSGLERLISGRRVVITGAGGSIGSELARQVADLRPSRLVLLDHSEFNLYSIDRIISERNPGLAHRAGLCDVRDRDRVRSWLMEERPEVVFHAAALKHVPIVEDNVTEGVLTNVIGTRNLADAAREAGARALVMISTDKAVMPSSVMGATKRVAEMYCQALDVARDEPGESCRFVTVRFGNVLGSTGSVVPLFQAQLAAGGPLTVTHPEVRRYFMTAPEAVELVLHASVSALDNHSGLGQIFMLDMGRPVKIADLARQMIRLAGKRPDIDVKIEYVGLRPGEKLTEELAYNAEGLLPTDVKGVLLARPAIADLAAIRGAVERLERAARSDDDCGCIELLRRLVPRAGDGMTPPEGSRLWPAPPAHPAGGLGQTQHQVAGIPA